MVHIELVNLLRISYAIHAAQECGVLSSLQEGAATIAEHAARRGLQPRGVERVLEVLVAVGLASRTDDRYDASPEFRALAKFEPVNVSMPALYGHIPEFLRTGKPVIAMDADVTARENAYRNAVPHLARLFEPAAVQLFASLPELRAKRVLDVGCGSGVWSLAYAERNADARVTGLDLPAVLDVFRTRASERGLANRIDTIGADMHEAQLAPGSFDLIVIANVLRLEEPPRAKALVARMARALSDDGVMLVVDALAGGTPDRECARALYALNLSLRTAHGTVHSPGTISAWLEDAGLGHVRVVDMDPGAGALGALVARR